MTTILLALFSHRNVFSHSPVDPRSEIKTSDFRGLERTGPCSPPTALGGVFFLSLLASDGSKHSLACSSIIPISGSIFPRPSSLFSFSMFVSYKDTALGFSAIHVVQDDLILLNP